MKDVICTILAVCAIFVIGFGLSGCAFGGLRYGESEYTDFKLHIQWVEDQGAMQRIARAVGASPIADAITVWQDVDGKRECFIYAIKPYSTGEWIRTWMLGHELMHCTDGDFH